MGIAWLLLRRTLRERPKRTMLFLLGYALATAVMITLLAVGEAVLIQAQDKDLLGGGDIILVPQGIDVESLKVGGVSALYFSIPQARFITRQLLGSSRFQNEISEISPYIFSKLLYLRNQKGQMEPVFGSGSIPDQEQKVKEIRLPWQNSAEDNEWLHPEAQGFYHDIDRFHLPSKQVRDLDRWAEWHYFNFESPDFYGYLSFMVAGDLLAGKANWIVSLQMVERNDYHKYSTILPADPSQIPSQKVDYSVGKSSIRFLRDHYQITLDFKDTVPVTAELKYYPVHNLYFPPTFIAKSDGFESGYVIPAIRGSYYGTLKVGSRSYNFEDIHGYHDHNWGIWQRIEWNWGHAYSDEYAIFFGEIFLNGKSKGLYAAVFDRSGFLSIFRPDQIRFSEVEKRPEGIQVPMKLEMEAQKPFTSFKMTGSAKSLIANPLLDPDGLYFIQYKMNYDVTLRIDGKTVQFPATGNAETYVWRTP
jgi:hypothetical protein